MDEISKNLEKLQKRLEMMRIVRISEDVNLRENMHHTIMMIYYAESPEVPEDDKGILLNRTVSEIELICQENQEGFPDPINRAVERQVAYARENIREKNYWIAIENISVLERLPFVKDYMPSYPSMEANTKYNLILIQKLLDGKTIIVERNDSNNLYNEEYLS